MSNLNPVELDFIDFMAQRNRRPFSEIEADFRATKDRFKLSGRSYRDVCETVYALHRILFDLGDEKEVIDAYRFHALVHLYRFISYSYPESAPASPHSLRLLLKSLYKGEVRKLYRLIRARFSPNTTAGALGGDYASIARYLTGQLNAAPVVVDYGCGLGYISFEIGLLDKDSKIFLLDIEGLTLEFARYRFQKHGIDAQAIPVTKDNLYPLLPRHNLCIATEVMEHLFQPLTAYQHIIDSMEDKGILFGNFSDHKAEKFHVSPDLGMLRERVGADFQPIAEMPYKQVCYRKVTG